jgi:hypothetical protein
MKILCRTLFDITKTDYNTRRARLESGATTSGKERNQQINYETILQILSIRAQPENISVPEKSMCSLSDWGSTYKNPRKIPQWEFTFEIDREEIFDDGISELGFLLRDCQDVPMIVGLEEWAHIGIKLDCSPELKNIHFEIVNDQQDHQ